MDTSWFFWKEAYLDYGQLLTDGFYHVRKNFQQLPTLAELIADPQLSGGQVIMVIDREQDAPLVTLEVLHRIRFPLHCRLCRWHEHLHTGITTQWQDCDLGMYLQESSPGTNERANEHLDG